jgi:hypothetical protein
MTDPKKPIVPTPPVPHPSSEHRTPSEIARDEAGPIGAPARRAEPATDVAAKKPPSKEDQHIREAVQRSAHPHDDSAPVKKSDRTRKHKR